MVVMLYFRFRELIIRVKIKLPFPPIPSYPVSKASKDFTKKSMKIFHPSAHGVNLVSVALSTPNHQLFLQSGMGLGKFFLPIWAKNVSIFCLLRAVWAWAAGPKCNNF
jgi:hypothetical protein